MTVRPARRIGGPGRRTRTVRRRSAGLTPVRAGAALAMLLSAAAIYGLAASSAFGFSKLRVEGATITGDAAIRDRIALASGTNLFAIRTEPIEAVLREIPAVADADVSVGLPDSVNVQVHERRPILVWRVDDRHWYVDETGLLFAEAPATRPGDLAGLPVIADDRLASRAFRVGSTIDPVDLDVARRLASLTPAQVGSAASGLSPGVTDENGFTLSSVPKGWVAVFGFYGLSQRTPDLVPGQVVLLQQLLHRAGEDTVAMVILADATDGTYIPRASPSPGASAKPSKAP
jgi:POTRA domain-containing FtsQ-type protein